MTLRFYQETPGGAVFHQRSRKVMFYSRALVRRPDGVPMAVTCARAHAVLEETLPQNEAHCSSALST